jgi:phage terminase large subunit
MTSSTASEVTRRKRGPKPQADLVELQSFSGSLASSIRAAQLTVANNNLRFPSPKYQREPVRFAHDVLGFEPWEKQVEILQAVRDHLRVAIASGHKIGKSTSAAILALWFYCSFHDARAIMSSTTARQVDQILWRETRILRARSGRCVACKRDDPEGIRIPKPCPHSAIIEGDMGDLARTGLRAPDFREVVGFTAREAEAVAGISGSNLLYILDEASGIPDVIYQAIEGNRAGGARIVLFGNPTKNSGEFFDAFHSKSKHYHTIRVSSEDTPNVRARRVVVPGLATYEWIEEKKVEWGEDSALYKIRIRGEFAINEAGRIFSVHMIEQSEIRWHTTPDAGCLFIGIDPAGESTGGDETLLCARRGLKQLKFQAHRGASAETVVTHLLRMIVELRLPREKPVVVIDAEGPIGIKLGRLLTAHLDEFPDTFELVRVYASNRAQRDPKAYERVRDELVANLEAWMRDGGAIVEDARLEAELHVLEWIEQPNGRLKLIPKDSIRRELDRSPDRLDSLALSTWEPLSLRTARTKTPRNDQGTPISPLANTAEALQARENVFDPYAATNPWRGDR